MVPDRRDRHPVVLWISAEPSPAMKKPVEDDRVCGFTTVGPSRDSDRGDVGELYAIYVHPNCWGGGIGRALIRAARRRLVEGSASEAILWVLDGNERAERFYRMDGWLPDGQRRRQDVHGIEVDELRYVTPLA